MVVPRAIGRSDRTRYAEERNSQFLQRQGEIRPLIFNFAAIELGHDAIEQNLLFAIGADANLALLVMTLAGPYREGGEAWFVSNQVELVWIDHLDIGNRSVGDRNPAHPAGEIDDLRGAGHHREPVGGKKMSAAGGHYVIS
jgi:hypothetical protein